jgi:hypothetical protein
MMNAKDLGSASNSMNWAKGWKATSMMLMEREGVALQFKKDGDAVVGLFVGEPFCWEERCADGTCALKIALNFFDRATCTMRVWAMAPRDFREVCRLRDRYSLESNFFRVFLVNDADQPNSRILVQHEAVLSREDRLLVDDATRLKSRHDLQAMFGGMIG